MSSDEEENVKLYSALQRNQKRQIFVTLSSSSESETERDCSFSSLDATPQKKTSDTQKSKRRKRTSSQDANPASTTASNVIAIDDDGDEDLLSKAEREAAMAREVEIQREIERRLAQDSVLNQTRAIMNKISAVQNQFHKDQDAYGVISLDSEDSDVEILTPAPSKPTTSTQDKGERLVLRIRSNGETVDEITVFSKEPLEQLYARFCDLHGLPRTAVQMRLDGESLAPQATAESNELESGDLIDATVDFSKQNSTKKRRLVRLRLVVHGKRPEIFKIDASAPLEKLHASFCKKHEIQDPDSVTMRVNGAAVDLTETVESFGFLDDDEIDVELKNYIDPAAVEVRLRFPDNTTENKHIVPSDKIETLLQGIASDKQIACSSISLRIDGEVMAPTKTFQYYDLEGGELIDVKL